MMTADDVIAQLGLEPHPREGGHFRETYRAAEMLTGAALPERYRSTRSACTAIYYLLKPGTCSALHRLQTDEIFHFYLGGPVRMLQLLPDGQGKTIRLGSDLLSGEQPQVVVPAGVWQGSYLEAGEFALLGCTVAPGFDYADYESASRAALIERYPEWRDMIERLTPAER